MSFAARHCVVALFESFVASGGGSVGSVGIVRSPPNARQKLARGSTHEATFPVHGVVTDNEARDGAQPKGENSYGFRQFPALAHHLAVYPDATGHFFNQLPRLFMLLHSLPPSVPIVMNKHKLSTQLVTILQRDGLVTKGRFIPLGAWDAKKRGPGSRPTRT